MYQPKAMSKKASQAQPVPQAGAGGGVDFLVRTMSKSWNEN